MGAAAAGASVTWKDEEIRFVVDYPASAVSRCDGTAQRVGRRVSGARLLAWVRWTCGTWACSPSFGALCWEYARCAGRKRRRGVVQVIDRMLMSARDLYMLYVCTYYDPWPLPACSQARRITSFSARRIRFSRGGQYDRYARYQHHGWLHGPWRPLMGRKGPKTPHRSTTRSTGPQPSLQWGGF